MNIQSQNVWTFLYLLSFVIPVCCYFSAQKRFLMRWIVRIKLFCFLVLQRPLICVLYGLIRCCNILQLHKKIIMIGMDVELKISSIGLFQCSSSCGRGLQSRVVQCMHKVTGRHGSDCPGVLKPPAYRQCHQGACNVKVNVNTITSPRLGRTFVFFVQRELTTLLLYSVCFIIFFHGRDVSHCCSI